MAKLDFTRSLFTPTMGVLTKGIEKKGQEMAKTNHMNKRMSQRGISDSMIDLVKEHGEDYGDKIFLTKKAIDRLIQEQMAELKILERMRKKKGLVVVSVLGTDITTYGMHGK